MADHNPTSTLQGQLAAPFDDVDHVFRVLPHEDGAVACKVLYFLRPSAIMRRLDDVFGPMNWSTELQPEVETAEGKRGLVVALTVRYGSSDSTTRTGVGTQHVNPFPGVVGAYDAAFARAAAQIGIGRYLWDLDDVYAEVDTEGNLTRHPLDLLDEAIQALG